MQRFNLIILSITINFIFENIWQNLFLCSCPFLFQRERAHLKKQVLNKFTHDEIVKKLKQVWTDS